MVTSAAPPYFSSINDKAMADYFFLYQQMGLDPKVRTYPEVDLRAMLLTTQSK